MDYLQAILLGVVQGLTEFLPVSSSGHLILVPALFGFEDQGLAMDAILHLATLLAIFIYFRKELGQLFRALYETATPEAQRRVAWGIVAATVPAVAVGLLFGDWIESSLRNTHFVAGNLILWSAVFWMADRQAKGRMEKPDEYFGLSWGNILFIGCAQAVALLPGTSRSGITIAAGLFVHLSQPAAARFAFLLGTPAILGAGLYKTVPLITQPTQEFIFTYGQLAVAFVTAFAVGYLAIQLLLKIVARVGLMPFIIYRLVLAGAIFLLI